VADLPVSEPLAFLTVRSSCEHSRSLNCEADTLVNGSSTRVEYSSPHVVYFLAQCLGAHRLYEVLAGETLNILGGVRSCSPGYGIHQSASSVAAGLLLPELRGLPGSIWGSQAAETLTLF
jgi:hypothetical protein